MSSRLTLPELLIFNDELAGLVRAGVPLPAGLQRLSRDLPGRIASLSDQLQNALARGETLADALRSTGAALPPAYSRLVRIGEQTGTLSTALESLSSAARNLQDLRRSLGRALWYPLIVVAYAYLLIVLFFSQGWQRYRDLSRDLHSVPSPRIALIDHLAETVSTWAWIPPAVLVLALLVTAVFRSPDILSFAGGIWIPGTRPLRRQWRSIQFTRLLAALIRLDLPLPQALASAAELTGDPPLRREAEHMAASLNAGSHLDLSPRRTSIPGLVKWWLAQSAPAAPLADGLDQVADGLQNAALLRAERLRLYFPILATLLIGGGAVLLYALLMMTVINDLWEGLLKL